MAPLLCRSRMCPARDCRVLPPAVTSHCGNPTTCAVSGCPCGRDTGHDAFLYDRLADFDRDLWECPDRRSGVQRSLPAEVQSWLGKGRVLSPVTTSASVCGQKRTLRVKRAGNTLTAFASAATPGPALGLEAPTIVFSATLVPNIPRLADHAAVAVPLAARLPPTADVAYARQLGVV
jgi:hypothetical protein